MYRELEAAQENGQKHKMFILQPQDSRDLQQKERFLGTNELD